MTYALAQEMYKKRHHRTVKTCWIADVKRKHNKTTRQAANRIAAEPMHPCPDHVFPKLKKILKELRMI